MSALAERKTCKNLSGIPLLEYQALNRALRNILIMQLSVCLVLYMQGLGTTACSFLGHAGLLEYAGVEEKTAGEGGERAEGGPHHFTSEHQARSAGPKGPDEPSQQSGIHSLNICPLFQLSQRLLEEVTQRLC